MYAAVCSRPSRIRLFKPDFSLRTLHSDSRCPEALTLATSQGPEIDVCRPARQGFGDTVHAQKIGRTGENKATVSARAILVNRPLDREEQIRLALDLVKRQPGSRSYKVVAWHPSAFRDFEFVQREIETVPHERLGTHQSALADLAGTHQHDDRRGKKGALEQSRSESGNVLQIAH